MIILSAFICFLGGFVSTYSAILVVNDLKKLNMET